MKDPNYIMTTSDIIKFNKNLSQKRDGTNQDQKFVFYPRRKKKSVKNKIKIKMIIKNNNHLNTYCSQLTSINNNLLGTSNG